MPDLFKSSIDRSDYIAMDRRYGQRTNPYLNRMLDKSEKYYNDPELVSKSIAKKMSQHVPSDRKIERTKYPTHIDAIEAVIPESDPRHGMATEIKNTFDLAMTDPRLRQIDPESVLDIIYAGNLAKRKESIHNYSWKNRHGLRILPGMSKPIRELPDQAQWDVAKPRDNYLSFGVSAAVGGATPVATWGATAAYTKIVAGTAVAPFPGARPIAAAAALAIPSFLAFDYVINRINKSEWGQENPGKATIAKLVLGGLTAAGVERISARAGLRVGTAYANWKSAGVKLAEEPTAANLLEVARTSKAQDKLFDKIRFKDDIKKPANFLYKDLEKKMRGNVADEIISGAPIKRSAINPQIVKPAEDTYLESVTKVVGTNRNIRFSKVLDSPTVDKKYTRKYVRDYESVVDKTTTGEAKTVSEAVVKTNLDKGIAKDMAKDIKFGEALVNGDTKVNSAMPGLKDKYAAQGEKYEPIKTTKTKKKEAKQKKVVNNVLLNADKSRAATEKALRDVKASMSGIGRVAQDSKFLKTGKYADGITETSNIDVMSGIPDFTSKDFKVFAKSPEFETWARKLSPDQRSSLIWDKDMGFNAKERLEKVHRQLTKEAQSKIKFDLDEVNAPMESMVEDISASPEGYLDGISFLEKNMTFTGYKKAVKELMPDEELAQLAKEAGLKNADELVETAFKAEKGELKKLLSILGMTVPLGALFAALSPQEADASVLSEVGKGVIKVADNIVGPKILGEAVANVSQKEAESFMKAAFDVANISKRITTEKIPNKFMIGLDIPPDIRNVVTNKEFFPLLRRVVTPHTEFQYYFKSATGADMLTLPSTGWTSWAAAAHENTKNGMQALENIFKYNGIASASNPVRKAMSPLVAKYEKQVMEYGRHQYYLKQHTSLLKSLEKKIGNAEKAEISLSIKGKSTTKLKGKLSEYKKSFKVIQEEQIKLTKRVEELGPVLNSYKNDWNSTVQALAKEHPSTRVFLAAEDTAEYEFYPWLKPLMKDAEVSAANDLKAFNQHYAAKMADIKEKIITSRPYMPHVAHPERDYKAIDDVIAAYGTSGTQTTPPMARFYSRGSNMLPMMPEAHYAMTSYIPEINLRMSAVQFWKPGQKGGWDAFMKSPLVMGNEGLSKAFSRFQEGFKPNVRGGVDRLAERLYGMEVARLLAFSASVPFKHSLKLVGDFRVFGTEGMSAWPDAFMSQTRNMLRKIGVDMEYNMKDTFIDAVTNTGGMVRTMSDIDAFRMPKSTYDVIQRRINEIGGAPVAAIEKVDRGISTLASLMIAQKRGMTPQQAMYSIYDTIIKTNFLSGAMNPGWLRDPKVRFFLMFQGTPYKIMQERLHVTARAGKGLKKGGDELLRQLRTDVKAGEHKLKWHLIKDAFNSEKDIFGTPYINQMMRQLTAMGIVLGTGKYMLDADLSNHLFHPPFVKPHKREIGLAFSPITNAAYRTWMRDEENDQDFWLSNFFKEWFGRRTKGFPVPIFVQKTLRLNDNDIPAIYRNSELKYFFAVPPAGESNH